MLLDSSGLGSLAAEYGDLHALLDAAAHLPPLADPPGVTVAVGERLLVPAQESRVEAVHLRFGSRCVYHEGVHGGRARQSGGGLRATVRGGPGVA